MRLQTFIYALTALIVIVFALVLTYQLELNTGMLPDKVVVFAASGLTQAMQDCATIYESQSGCKAELNLASSAVLARQIAAGADWDVYVSANRQWMQYVLEQTGQSSDGVVELAADRLVLVTPADKDIDFSLDGPFAETFAGRLATGDPLSVPVGIYAKQALGKLGWWDDLSDNIIPAVNVSAALRYVEAGQCEAGIVYLSGARMSRKVTVVHIFDQSLHEPIRFLAIAKRGSEAGRRFLQFVSGSQQADAVFRHNGFNTSTGE